MADPSPAPAPATVGALRARWAPTKALGRAALVTGVLVLLAVLIGRLDLVVLATPFALGVAWGLRRGPSEAPNIEVALPVDAVYEGDRVEARLRLGNPGAVRFDLAVARLGHSSWVRLHRGDRPYGTELPPGQSAEVTLFGAAERWGYHQVGPAVAYAVAGDGLLISEQTVCTGGFVRVLPQMPPFRAADAMPRASALVGVHRSRRPGEGGELAGVRRYGPGDRLRRVDWRITLRTRELHVAHTLSDRDAEVVVLLDVLLGAGRSGGVHGAPSVLDTTVRAAAAVTEYYLRLGDRVALFEFSGNPRHLRAASGGRQLQVALEWLLLTRVASATGRASLLGIDPHVIPSSALVVVLTPLLAPTSAEMIAMLAQAGRVVVAVDTLGELAQRLLRGSQWTDLARRLWRMERDHTIGQLREVGVPVTTWAGAGSLDQVLRDMTRLAAAPRMAHR